jgi:hypothetical protein
MMSPRRTKLGTPQTCGTPPLTSDNPYLSEPKTDLRGRFDRMQLIAIWKMGEK